jgi:hypothetical protein
MLQQRRENDRGRSNTGPSVSQRCLARSRTGGAVMGVTNPLRLSVSWGDRKPSATPLPCSLRLHSPHVVSPALHALP